MGKNTYDDEWVRVSIQNGKAIDFSNNICLAFLSIFHFTCLQIWFGGLVHPNMLDGTGVFGCVWIIAHTEHFYIGTNIAWQP